MTLNRLRYFVEICNQGSLSHASKVLYVSQPALSSAIKQMENEYNVTLFERKNNSLFLTEIGEFFYDRAKAILDSVNMLEKDLKLLSNKVSNIRIGVPPMIGSFLFPKIYDKYSANHENTKFEIWEEGSLSIRSRILNRTLNVGFSITNDSDEDMFNKEIILDTEYLYCVSKNHPLAKKSFVTIEDIKYEPIVLMREGAFQNRLITEMYAKVGHKPNIALISSQISVLRNFIKNELGNALLIKELLDPSDDAIVGVPFKEKLSLKIGLLWRKEAKLTSEAYEFIEYVKDLDL